MFFSNLVGRLFGKSKVESHQVAPETRDYSVIDDPPFEKIEMPETRRGTTGVPGAFGGGSRGPFDPRPAMKPGEVKAMDAKRRAT